MLLKIKEAIPNYDSQSSNIEPLEYSINRITNRFVDGFLNNLEIPIKSLVRIENDLGKHPTLEDDKFITLECHVISDNTMMQIMKRLQDIKQGGNNIAGVNEIQTMLSMF